MAPVVRFAPSPTGLLHVGNARVALINWLHAKSAGGRFVLRLDDTDPERDRPEFVAAIERDLKWLGLDWDLMIRQSDRLDKYAAAAERLKAIGRLYPCYETPEELALWRKTQQAAGRAPIYRRFCTGVDDRSRPPHWRFAIEPGAIDWRDAIHGPLHFEGAAIGDPVLVRADGRPLYTLSSVVDDLDLGIASIVRGDDHIANTAVQIQLFSALGGQAEALTFGHLPLLTDAAGQGLSKRLGSLSLQSLREQGIEALAVVSYLARLGSTQDIAPLADLAEAKRGFGLGMFNKASPKFDPAELARLNARLLHGLAFEAVRARVPGLDPALWDAVRGNLATLTEIAYWQMVVAGPLAGTIEDQALCAKAAEILPAEPWDGASWSAWTKALSEATGHKGRALFHPLRLALTGREQGPEMKALLPLIGRGRAAARLGGRAA
ncbi:MAG: glutamate--tRNA ligase [Alphaproteobacteria bacterium]|nr:glutamate--tRNA ligase [Alphaproteobacteria bacterium]